MGSKLYTRGERIFKWVSLVLLLVICVATLAPFVLILASSLTDETTLITYGYSFWPKKFSMDSYLYMWNQRKQIGRSYLTSLGITAVGTVVSLLFTTMLAYPMSRKDFKYSNQLSFFVFFTMLFNGGIVSSYIMWTQVFHIKNTYFALLLPNLLMNAMNIMLVRNYYKNSIPFELVEAAEIDGASELKTFWKIMVPLSVPVNVTVGLFTGLAYWNDWINALYYVDDPVYYGIQNFLVRMMNNIQFLSSGSAAAMVGSGMASLPSTGIRMALAVVGVLPIVVVYPFLQKYLTKGVIMGAVKG